MGTYLKEEEIFLKILPKMTISQPNVSAYLLTNEFCMEHAMQANSTV